MDNFIYLKKNGASHIGDMEILLSLRILSTTTMVRMIQPSKIACWETHQFWSHKIAKDQDMLVYTLQIKEVWMTKTIGCLKRYMWIYSVYCMLPHIYIFYFYEEKKKKSNTDVNTMCGNTLLPVINKACVPHFISL